MRMSYLDDFRDEDWVIDPSSITSDLDLEQVLTDMVDRLLTDERHEITKQVALKLIVRGAMELARRTDQPLGQCLDTSMIWYYG